MKPGVKGGSEAAHYIYEGVVFSHAPEWLVERDTPVLLLVEHDTPVLLHVSAQNFTYVIRKEIYIY